MVHEISYTDYRAKVHAAWLGKSLGGAIGARMENHKTRMNLTRDELWPKTIAANDDLDIQLVWLEAFQERGVWLSSDDLAEFWQDRCWYNFCEYGFFLNNFQRGIHAPLSGTWNNRFFFESEGCPIRSEIWGLVCPGNPALAADYARLDAQLDHGGASVLCEMFLAAAAAAAFFDDDLGRVLAAGLAVLPPGGPVRRMVAETAEICAAHPRHQDAWRLLVRRFGDRDASKAIMNQAIVVMALTLGKGDFAETIRLACNSGWDTDCTAATAGALLGLMKGHAAFPAGWVEKLGKTLACGIKVKHQHATFDELAEDTARVGVEVARLRGADVVILQAPELPLRPRPEPGVKLGVAYPDEPALRPGRNTPLRLLFTNESTRTLSGPWRLEAPERCDCSCREGTLSLAPGETAELELLVSPRPGPLWDKNLFALHWDGAKTYRFGLSGARLWRVYGPYWDMWDTTKDAVCPYNHDNVFSFPKNGDSWNHYARLDRPYLDEERLLREDLPGELPEELAVGEDYLDGAQLAGFRGQACFYLVRELVAAEPTQVTFNLTCDVPSVIWIDGKELCRREAGRGVSLQDGGKVGPVEIGPTPKRLVVKVARQSDALSLCLIAIAGGDPEHKRGISMFADCLGDLPLPTP